MKTSTPLLSVEQKRAKEHYLLALIPAMVLAVFGSALFIICVSLLFRHQTGNRDPLGSFGSVFCVFGAFLLAHGWSLRKVRRAGLSLESQHVEVIKRATIDFQGEAVSWCYPKTLSGAMAYPFFLMVVCAGGWWLWRSPSPSVSVLQNFIGFVAFWMFLWASCVSIIFFRSPRVQIDQTGIAAFASEFWRRRILWEDVAQCEIRHFYNYMGQGPTRFIYFKSASGKILLQLNPASLANFSSDEQAEIEREIKRRLGHTTEESSFEAVVP